MFRRWALFCLHHFILSFVSLRHSSFAFCDFAQNTYDFGAPQKSTSKTVIKIYMWVECRSYISPRQVLGSPHSSDTNFLTSTFPKSFSCLYFILQNEYSHQSPSHSLPQGHLPLPVAVERGAMSLVLHFLLSSKFMFRKERVRYLTISVLFNFLRPYWFTC